MRELKYEGDTFTSLPEDFAGHYRIPKGIKIIADEAFANCKYLKSIDIPEGVTSIGTGVFSMCTNLEEITIPEGVTSIGTGVFLMCTNLKEITIPEGVTSIGERAFSYCRNLKEITIPEGVTSIGNDVFRSCINLKEIIIPEGVTSIGKSAFSFCSNLKEIIIPEGVTSIGKRAFSFCTNLKEITIPSTLTKVGEDFLIYTSFSDGEINDILEYINNEDKTKPENKHFTHTIQEPNKKVNECESKGNEKKEYKDSEYKSDKNIEICAIPEGFTSIGDGAFGGCSALTQIEIPSSVTKIGFYAFGGCSALEHIEIPSSVTKIGFNAFEGCSALEHIEIPSSVTSIGNKAFDECNALKKIAILGNSTAIDWPLFRDCTSLEKVIIKSSRYILENGLIYNKAKTELFECISTLCDKNVVIDPKVRIIHSRAFHNLEKIESITLPRNLTIIEKFAFDFSGSKVNLTVQTERMEQIKVDNFGLSSFKNLDKGECSLTVPIGTCYAYRHHPVWGKFKHINVAPFDYGEEPESAQEVDA